MKSGFYPKLALDGVRKNRRMYLPYLFTCIGIIMMTYIVAFICYSPVIAGMNGGATLQAIMEIGVVAMIFFAAIFLFYTDSFLLKRRKKEFGLYNVLGMGKTNLGKVLLWESFFIALISLSSGLLLGIVFSKLIELGLANMLESEITYSLSAPAEAICITAGAFAVIFLLLFLNSLRQIRSSGAVSLLKSENIGEKPPRASLISGVAGVLLLGAAYYTAVTIKDPVSALTAFMIAVLMVIAGTYLIMIFGTVLFCRILQKKKSYYYKPNHFVTVSSMAYRMKRNGAGLASICVLATMVLVMLSSSSALFFGGESVIYSRYPREINAYLHNDENREISSEDQSVLEKAVEEVLESNGASANNIIKYRCAAVAGLLGNGKVVFDVNEVNDLSIAIYPDLRQFYLIPVEDYNCMMKKSEILSDDEVLIYDPKNTFNSETFGFAGLKQYNVKEVIGDFFLSPEMLTNIVPSIVVVVPDLAKISEGLTDVEGNALTYTEWNYLFDTTADDGTDIAISEEIAKAAVKNMQSNGGGAFTLNIESRAYERKDFYSLYGGLFYLGIILSIVFLFAAVLIIYYKQLTEGYEDVHRFEIMQKIGMTKREIRRSVNSQLLTVFLLPLGMAGLHLAFAFPIVEKLLLCFNLDNRALFVSTAIGSFIVFALFYIVVYRITSNAYCKIVGGGSRRK